MCTVKASTPWRFNTSERVMLGFLAVAAVVCVVMLGWHWVGPWLESHDKLSGWAQFVGAMLALTIAIWQTTSERHRQRETLRVKAAGVRRVVAVTVKQAADLIQRAHLSSIPTIEPPYTANARVTPRQFATSFLNATAFVDTAELLRELPDSSLEDELIAELLVRARHAYSMASDAAQRVAKAWAEGKDPDDLDREVFDHWRGELLAASAELLRRRPPSRRMVPVRTQVRSTGRTRYPPRGRRHYANGMRTWRQSVQARTCRVGALERRARSCIAFERPWRPRCEEASWLNAFKGHSLGAYMGCGAQSASCDCRVRRCRRSVPQRAHWQRRPAGHFLMYQR